MKQRSTATDRIPEATSRLAACTDFVLSNPGRYALFLDVDGTLIELADTPEAVIVPDGLIALLQRLALGLDGAMAIVTGRLISDIDHLLSPLRLAAAGVHGAEMRLDPDLEIERVTAGLPDEIIQTMRKLALDIPGVIAEPKGGGLALHYRLAPDAEREILAALTAAIERHAGALELVPGKKIFEVVPSGLSKGTALAKLATLPAFRNRIPIMIGDDVGDEPAFAVAEGLKGFGLRVAGEHHPPDIADFPGPSAVMCWLDQLSHRLPAAGKLHSLS
ncbi:trehalose-phosphatase [Hyphomicrobium nitrativorans NL23]|uniref:Trehalose 6-phosphate phosphatase n=1 Tax=Hyphomicrobium nitrativorans NL23 TaxID=1029756 RepID=V5SFR4_9HYPH|nr:trehalose-phosphatase [Hyphomicrobium nitrativorans]AHB49332.1 trehalose-phosphatase [Hyphomicrobium nitrativorans NL23]